MPSALSFYKDFAYERGKDWSLKLKKIIPRQQFEVPIQAAIGHKIVARTGISRPFVETSWPRSVMVLGTHHLTETQASLKNKKLVRNGWEGHWIRRKYQEAFLSVLSMDEE